MDAILHPLKELESYQSMVKGLSEGKKTISAEGVIDSQKCHLAFAVANELNALPVIVTYSELQAKDVYSDMSFFVGENIKLYPSKDILFYSADVRSANLQKQRLEILEILLSNRSEAIVLSIEALLDGLMPRKVFEGNILKIELGQVMEQDTLIDTLARIGYERAEMVEGIGQFAVRGAIVDVYPGTYENALRIEFWDNEIDSIRFIDTRSQRSIEKLKEADIFPMSEVIPEFMDDPSNVITSLFDYLPGNAIIFFDEIHRAKERVDNVFQEFSESMQNKQMLSEREKRVIPYQQILSHAEKFSKVLLSTLGHVNKDFNIDMQIGFSVKSTNTFKQQADLLIDDLKFFCSNGYRILILAGSGMRARSISEDFQNRGLSSRYIETLKGKKLDKGVITIANGSLKKGFEYQYINMVVISAQELFGAEKKKKRLHTKQTSKIEIFADLNVGDYIVHDNHGIGIFKGMEQIAVDNIYRDYLKIEYAGGGNLYVNVQQMDTVQKYIGSDSVGIKLNKLGGSEWGKVKAKAKKAVQDMADQLIKLYAARKSAKGFQFSKDTVWQNEFEEMTPFEETEDQIVAIEEVKADMESDKVMDRLICGDVGYGKTEVAIRAAFKAVQDSKQVAFLVPTTILAQQHYNTFVQRMKDFPIEIDIMSRFRSHKQIKATLERIKKGHANIVIGTHKLLGRSVEFKDLGLIIIDEEQRFGVTHKEKLKSLKANVDVMTLTATPIPRTLHMSLTGIRDMSVLEQPPQERQPVQTYVIEYEGSLIRDAIKRELARGGQVYYLHNRVHNISETAAKLQSLVPEAAITFAHGRMSEYELENVMMDFIEGEIDVLVCTTIIETGLDISNVNTIIIEDAENMGLSQLYQLRGRVGRSNRLAYAYLMYRRNKVLNEIAEKRLQTIREFTEFGSGFKIAMRDLEIRGSGNLLGGQQHGHIEAIGYDMYCKLLAQAISLLQGSGKEDDFETSIDININAYIPASYIKNEERRLEIYKKISLIVDDADYRDIQEEIEDRFGTLPSSVQNILDIALLKAYAHSIGIVSIKYKSDSISINFKPDADVDIGGLIYTMQKRRSRLSFSGNTLQYRVDGEPIMVAVENITKLIRTIANSNSKAK